MARTLSQWGLPGATVFGDLQREMNRVLDHFTDGTDNGHSLASFNPKANLAETDKTYELSLELPGLKPEEIQLEFRDGQLWITGERKRLKEEKGKTFHRVESEYGHFRRVVALGNDVDGDCIEASYRDGILTVVINKTEAVQPKRIAVKS